LQLLKKPHQNSREAKASQYSFLEKSRAKNSCLEKSRAKNNNKIYFF
jgi:hypothetical protein